MPSNKIIAIVGATGNQGMSVAQTFLSLPHWSVRCLTRNPSSAPAARLRSLGAEVVQADLDDPASLGRAFAGASAVFVNTDFWAPYLASLRDGGGGSNSNNKGGDAEESSRFGRETELRHAINAADEAAKSPTLERFIYSALGPMSRASGGKYTHSHHWESKAAAADYIESLPGLAGKWSFVYMGAYSTNAFLLPQRVGTEWQLRLPGPPTTRFPVIDVARSTGKFVRALVEDEVPGTKLMACDADITAAQALDAWVAVTGESGNEARVVQLEYEEMRAQSGLPPEVLDGAAFLGEYEFMAGVGGNVVHAVDLTGDVELISYEDILRARPMEELLQSKFQSFT